MIVREARLEDAAGIAKVYVDGWRTTYPGIVSDEYLANMAYEKYTDHWSRILSTSDGFFYVAEDEVGNIVGFIWGAQSITVILSTRASYTQSTFSKPTRVWGLVGASRECWQKSSWRWASRQ